MEPLRLVECVYFMLRLLGCNFDISNHVSRMHPKCHLQCQKKLDWFQLHMCGSFLKGHKEFLRQWHRDKYYAPAHTYVACKNSANGPPRKYRRSLLHRRHLWQRIPQYHKEPLVPKRSLRLLPVIDTFRHTYISDPKHLSGHVYFVPAFVSGVCPDSVAPGHTDGASKNKMKPTNPNADTYVDKQRQYLFVTLPANSLVRHPEFTHWGDTLVGRPCLTLLRKSPVRHSCLTLFLDTLIWHSCKTLLLDTLVGHFLLDTLVRHSYLTLLTWHFLLDTFVRHSCLTLLWDTLTWHSCKTLLIWHSCKTLLLDTLTWHFLLDTPVRHSYLTLL